MKYHSLKIKLGFPERKGAANLVHAFMIFANRSPSRGAVRYTINKYTVLSADRYRVVGSDAHPERTFYGPGCDRRAVMMLKHFVDQQLNSMNYCKSNMSTFIYVFCFMTRGYLTHL